MLSVKRGMKFKSTTFFMLAEIADVRTEENEVDVILTPSDGNAWVERSWNLKEVVDAFDKKQYLELATKSSHDVW